MISLGFIRESMVSDPDLRFYRSNNLPGDVNASTDCLLGASVWKENDEDHILQCGRRGAAEGKCAKQVGC